MKKSTEHIASAFREEIGLIVLHTNNEDPRFLKFAFYSLPSTYQYLVDNDQLRDYAVKERDFPSGMEIVSHEFRKIQ